MHVESTDDVTIDGVIDFDSVARAVVGKLQDVYGLDI